MPLLVNLDNYSYLQLLSIVVSKLPISVHSSVCTRYDRDQHYAGCEKAVCYDLCGMLLDIVAPLIGTKLQCLVLIKSIVTVTS